MASAVIRVKRRITDEPFDKFVLNCKRQKTNHDLGIEEIGANAKITDQTDTKTILKLAATVSVDDDIKTHLTRLQRSDPEEIANRTHKPVNVIARLREQLKDDARNSRFKVVNCFRSIENDADEKSADGITSRDVTVVDVIKEELESKSNNSEIEGTTITEPSQSIDKFVYDLYLVDSGEQPTEIDIDSYIIRPFDDLMYQVNDDTLDKSDIDSEDSNDEANWRNEYPDTDDGLSIGEEDMRRAVEDLNFGSENDNLSSDDDDSNYGEDPVIHFIDENDGDDDENEYGYFKKYGQVRNHASYYRSNRSNQANLVAFDEDDSDIDDNPSSNSSTSNVSPLASCDENDD